MSLLKKENWFICAILVVLTHGLFFLVMAYFMNLFKKNAWYADVRYWLVGTILCFFPIPIMVLVLLIQMMCTVAKTLHVPGEEIYGVPYSWILCIIIPIVGWTLLIIMFLYLLIWSIVMLKRGEGERFLKEG